MNLRINKALISVSDKAHLEKLARKLHSLDVEIISTGGTGKKLTSWHIPYTPIEKVSKNPEAFNGRMKTLSFQIESALLYRRDVKQDCIEAKELGIQPIDLVICNLYPFKKVLEQQGSEDELVENIDIGGPTMIRAAAKNFKDVCVCTDPSSYDSLIDELADNAEVSLKFRREQAAYAFDLTASYDCLISSYFCRNVLSSPSSTLLLGDAKELRYGENPHQQAYMFNPNFEPGSLANAEILQGKQLSYNNFLDADAAFRCTSDIYHCLTGHSNFKSPKVVSVIKHMNPCGIAAAPSLVQALEEAWAGDPISAFGSIICFSEQVTLEEAQWLDDKFVEVLIAPSFSKESLEIFKKKKNLRLLCCSLKKLYSGELNVKSINGGYLIQNEDENNDPELEIVSKRSFPEKLIGLAHFGIMSCKHLKSNAIAIVARKQNQDNTEVFSLVGAGMGQPNRIDSMKKLAIPRYKEKSGFITPILISDAFYPFADSIDAAAEDGFEFLVSPGGSIRDHEVIAKCDEKNISMIFTHRRHFRH